MCACACASATRSSRSMSRCHECLDLLSSLQISQRQQTQAKVDSNKARLHSNVSSSLRLQFGHRLHHTSGWGDGEEGGGEGGKGEEGVGGGVVDGGGVRVGGGCHGGS